MRHVAPVQIRSTVLTSRRVDAYHALTLVAPAIAAKFKPGQFVIGSFLASDNTCPNCLAGYQSGCVHAEFVSGAQAPLLRVPLADYNPGLSSRA